MAAYNWITFHELCPTCNKHEEFNCQTHIASSFDGDDGGRFCDNYYKIGDQMKWYPKSDIRYNDWRQGNFRFESELPSDEDKECCYAECKKCKTEQYASFNFKDCVITEMISFGGIENWPSDYYK